MRMDRRAFCTLLLLPLLSAGCAKPPVTQPAAQPAAGATRFRVLTYNIHHGEGTDGKFDVPRIAKLIKSLEPDLVAVQEVDVKTRRSSGVDQAAELARLTGLHPFFHRIIDYQGGPYGIMILSRHKPLETAKHPLPYYPVEEPRALAEMRLRLGDGGPEVAFFCTHLDYKPSDEVRVKQVAEIEKVTAEVKSPLVILAGDLNAEPPSRPIVALLKSWQDATAAREGDPMLTYPSEKPVKKIDYVLFRPSPRLKVIESRVIDEPVASDHRPVLAVFEVGG